MHMMRPLTALEPASTCTTERVSHFQWLLSHPDTKRRQRPIRRNFKTVKPAALRSIRALAEGFNSMSFQS